MLRFVSATVVAVIPEYHQAELEDGEGYRYALVRDLYQGSFFEEAEAGQLWNLILSGPPWKVIQANRVV